MFQFWLVMFETTSTDLRDISVTFQMLLCVWERRERGEGMIDRRHTVFYDLNDKGYIGC